LSRAERLLELLQVLRRKKYAARGRALADELGISLRTLYRDIETLRAQGAPIEGEAGVGYLLKPGFTVPPLMFTIEELEALMLGARWVLDRGDGRLGLSARNALAKIVAVLPPALAAELDSGSLRIAVKERPRIDDAILRTLREAIRGDRKVTIVYSDSKAQATRRTIWPFALVFFDEVQLVSAWCEERGDFRHFRADRIGECVALETGYPRRHQDLLAEWQESRGIPTKDSEI
jgi:predicted DNA-binding transcriptional regulator YafY